MPALDQLCQPVAVVPVEHVSPREVVSDLLTESQGWERRERTLTHLRLVDVVILRCLLPRHWLQAVYGHLTRATGWLRATGADGGGLVLPASHAGHRCAAAAGPARLPPTGQRPDHRRLCLWAAADGHRQDAGRCAGHPGQRGLLWPGGQWAQRQSLPFPSRRRVACIWRQRGPMGWSTRCLRPAGKARIVSSKGCCAPAAPTCWCCWSAACSLGPSLRRCGRAGRGRGRGWSRHAHQAAARAVGRQ